MLAILALGQSNMEGAFGPSPTAGMYAPPVHAWDLASAAFVPATLGTAPFRSGSPVPNNLAYVFAVEAARHREEEASVVLIASGGKKIEYFIPGSVLTANGWTNAQTSPEFGASAADELMNAAPSPAMAALQSLGKSKYDVVLMHQGEANDTDTAQGYADKLRALFTAMEAAGTIELGVTYIMLGYIHPAYPHAAAHAAGIEAFALLYPRVASVPWGNVQIVGSGNKHATGKGLEVLGTRYFNVYQALGGVYKPIL